MDRSRFTVLLLAAGLAWSAAAAAQSTPSGMLVSRGGVKYRSASRDGTPRHSLRLKAALSRPEMLAGMVAETAVEARLGAETVFAVDGEAADARVRIKGQRRWKATVRGSAGGIGSRQLKLDLLRGTVDLRVRKADLSRLRTGARTDLPLTLRVGTGTAETTISFEIRKASRPERWELVPVGVPGGGGGGAPGGGGDPGGGGGGVEQPLPLRGLASGMRTEIVGRTQREARTQTEWAQLWLQHAGTTSSPPAVDFSSEMVVAVFLGYDGLGAGPTETGIRVACVRENGARVLVLWEKVPNVPYDGCPPPGQKGPCISASPFHFVAVERRTFEVRFAEVSAANSCP